MIIGYRASSLSLLTSSSSIDASLALVNSSISTSQASSRSISSSSSSVDLLLFEARQDESGASSRINDYNTLIVAALESISSRESSLQSAPAPTTAEDFIVRFTTGLDLDYSDDQKASLSNLRVSERLRELSGLERIVETNSQGVEALAETRVAISRTDLSDQLSRLRELTQAEESARNVRRRLLGTLEDRLGTFSVLQANRVSALLGARDDEPTSSASSLNATILSKRPTSFKV